MTGTQTQPGMGTQMRSGGGMTGTQMQPGTTTGTQMQSGGMSRGSGMLQGQERMGSKKTMRSSQRDRM